jgi:DNA polymerase-3 subunit delta'
MTTKANTPEQPGETVSAADKLSHSLKLFGKDSVKSRLSALVKSGRMPHTVIFTGAKGVGKLVCAKFWAALLICEDVRDNEPCGVCRQCKLVAAMIHPDVIYPEKSGKSLIYTRETMRNVCSDVFIKPNDTDSKIVIFADFENTETVSQNVLLKIIEDPPEGVHFIFTATDTGNILPTILSRAAVINVPEAPESMAFEALEHTGDFTPDECSRAVAAFHGNIGDCLGFLTGGEQAENMAIAVRLADSLAKSDEYGFLAALAGVNESKARLKQLMLMSSKIVRDAVILSDTRMSTNNDNRKLIGGYPDGALKIAQRVSKKRLLLIYDKMAQTAEKLDFNVNVGLISANLCAEIFSRN